MRLPGRFLAAWSLAFGACAWPGTAAAQLRVRPADDTVAGARWAALEDSVAALRDPATLPTAPAPARAAADTAATAWMRRGFVVLRRYELTRRHADFDSARGAFERAVRAAPGSAWASYGLARALLHDPELDPQPGQLLLRPTLRKVLGRDPRTRGEAALRRALELQPDFPRAARLLADGVFDRHLELSPRHALAALSRADSAGRADAVTLVALSRVQSGLGDLDAAESAARRALARAPGSPEALRALAEALLRQPGREREGARSYFAGVESGDSAGLDPYLRDIEVYLGQRGLDSLRAAGVPAGRRALRRFWAERAALAGTTVAERLATHYRRLAVARDLFLRRSNMAVMNAPGSNLFARQRLPPKDQELDDRGVIYVRYGPPDRIVTSGCAADATGLIGAPLQGCGRDISWYYDIGGGRPLALNFAGYYGGTYYLMGTLPCDESYLEARWGLDPTAMQYYSACRANHGLALQMYDANTRSVALLAERRERGLPPFRADLPFAYDLATLAGPAGATTVVATLGVPLAALHADTVAGGLRYTVHVLVAVADTQAGTVEDTTVTRTLETAVAPAPNADWRFTLELGAPPSPHAVYRVRLDEPASGAGKVYGGPHPLPDYAPDRLSLSDVLLAAPDSGGAWERQGVRLDLTPTAVFRDGAFSTYYEIYHLPPGTTYRTEIEVGPTGGGLSGALGRLFGGGRTIRLDFDGRATGQGTLPELHRIASRLPPGRYRLRIRVSAPELGQSAVSDRDFTVRPFRTP
jgi:tetratricopeptide (TPR) repeat protein